MAEHHNARARAPDSPLKCIPRLQLHKDNISNDNDGFVLPKVLPIKAGTFRRDRIEIAEWFMHLIRFK